MWVTVNDLLSTLGIYLKIKAFWWAFIRTGRLIGPGCLSKKKKKEKANTTKIVRQVNFLQKPQNSFQNSFQN